MMAGSSAPLLVFDGGCLFCRHFAQLSELRSGIPGLQIRDGRADQVLRRQLAARGYALQQGAVLVVGEQVLHGAAAIQWLCARMVPSAALLQLLAPLLAQPERARRLYPVLLLARRLALALRGLPLDPDGAALQAAQPVSVGVGRCLGQGSPGPGAES
jgi:hypothetical protein